MGLKSKPQFQKPMGLPLFIGSLPFEDHQEALVQVLRRTPQSPHWVQLPVHPKESFLLQFSEGLPGLRVGPRVWVQNQGEDFEKELLIFYESYLAVNEGREDLDSSLFAMSREAVPGLYKLIEFLGSGNPVAFVKGQLSGPLSVLTGLQDSDGRWAYHDEKVREATVKLLCLRARWQARKISQVGNTTLLFVDEPTLGNLGSSSLINISVQAVLEDLREIFAAVEAEGGWPGLHVCANADWGLLLGLKELRVLSFDAYSYFERVALFKRQLMDFLDRGGILAWGMIPTRGEDLDKLTVEILADQWVDKARALEAGRAGLKRILESSFITPACGLGSVSPRQAEWAMDLTVQVSERLRKSFGMEFLGPAD